MPRTETPFASNEEVMAAAGGVHRDTLRRWVKLGILPAPTTVSRGRRGARSRWPVAAVERAIWIREQLEIGYSLAEIAERAEELEGGIDPGS